MSKPFAWLAPPNRVSLNSAQIKRSLMRLVAALQLPADELVERRMAVETGAALNDSPRSGSSAIGQPAFLILCRRNPVSVWALIDGAARIIPGLVAALGGLRGRGNPKSRTSGALPLPSVRSCARGSETMP